mgnify:CR=1 FL=1
MNFISLFSGGGGADIGVMMAGYTPVAANEYDPAIAAVYAENIGDHIRVGDILTQDPHDYPACDLLHASPPCPNFSVAKAGAKETAHDIALAEKVAEFIRVLAPRSVTIENVSAYRKSKSYRIILRAIEDRGYMYDAAILNSADYGVPQIRRRLILRAVRGLLRPMPEPTKWIGWYEVIKDLIDTLPESKFADWQLKRLPESFIIGNSTRSNTRLMSEPVETITGNSNQIGIKAFITDARNGRFEGGKMTILSQELPSFSVIASNNPNRYRAFLMPNANSSSGVNRSGDKTAPTVGNVNRVGNQPRAWLDSGRVVKMTPRALARFQSFPDWYKLPEKISLACKIIGNACPPLMYEVVARSLTEAA